MDSSIADIGGVIKRRRAAAGMNIKELARETGYSAAYISQVETGATLPSLSALATIATVLGTDIQSFFHSMPAEGVRVSRAGDVNTLRMAPSASEEYTILSSHGIGSPLSALIQRADPDGQPPVKFRNVGERFALVLSGTVRFTFNGAVDDLAAGDCVHFNSQTPYSMQVTSSLPAEILWFVSPAIV